MWQITLDRYVIVTGKTGGTTGLWPVMTHNDC